MRGRPALREHFRAKSTETVRFRASLGVRAPLCVAMHLTGWEACLPGQPGWLSSVLNLVTLLTFSFVTFVTPLTLKPPCRLISLGFRLK